MGQGCGLTPGNSTIKSIAASAYAASASAVFVHIPTPTRGPWASLSRPSTGALVVDLGTSASDQELVWTAPRGLQPGDNQVVPRVVQLVERAQTAAANKSTILSVLTANPDPLRAVLALRETLVRGAVVGERVPQPESLVAAVTELITAHPGAGSRV